MCFRVAYFVSVLIYRTIILTIYLNCAFTESFQIPFVVLFFEIVEQYLFYFTFCLFT